MVLFEILSFVIGAIAKKIAVKFLCHGCAAVFEQVFDIIHLGELVHVVCPQCFHGDYVRLPNAKSDWNQEVGWDYFAGKLIKYILPLIIILIIVAVLASASR